VLQVAVANMVFHIEWFLQNVWDSWVPLLDPLRDICEMQAMVHKRS
jgi:hypothetical protein